jgi:hypothetical protein
MNCYNKIFSPELIARLTGYKLDRLRLVNYPASYKLLTATSPTFTSRQRLAHSPDCSHQVPVHSRPHYRTSTIRVLKAVPYSRRSCLAASSVAHSANTIRALPDPKFIFRVSHHRLGRLLFRLLCTNHLHMVAVAFACAWRAHVLGQPRLRKSRIQIATIATAGTLKMLYITLPPIVLTLTVFVRGESTRMRSQPNGKSNAPSPKRQGTQPPQSAQPSTAR